MIIKTHADVVLSLRVIYIYMYQDANCCQITYCTSIQDSELFTGAITV